MMAPGNGGQCPAAATAFTAPTANWFLYFVRILEGEDCFNELQSLVDLEAGVVGRQAASSHSSAADDLAAPVAPFGARGVRWR